MNNCNSSKAGRLLIISIICGIIVGMLFPEFAKKTSKISDIYLKLIEICVYPILILSIVRGFIQYNIISIKKINVYLKYWIGTAVLISVIGIIIGIILITSNSYDIIIDEYNGILEISVWDTISNMFPNNIFSAFVSDNVIQVVVASIIIGIAASRIKILSMMKALENALDLLWEWLNGYMSLIVAVLPIGVFFLVERLVVNTTVSLAQSIFSLLLCILIGYLLLIFIIYPIIIKGVLKENPIQFFCKFKNALVTAFLSCSSSTAYPLVIEAAQKNYTQVTDTVGGIALIMKHANCLQTPVYYIWGASLSGQNVTLSKLLLSCVLGIITSVGTAGIPGGGIIVIAISFKVVFK